MELKKVQDMNTLKAMQKAGFIELHHQTGKTVTFWGMKGKAWYVDRGDSMFTFKGKTYVTEFRSGCFSPFIFEVIKNE